MARPPALADSLADSLIDVVYFAEPQSPTPVVPATMLSTRVLIGLSMVAGLLAILILDEWLEPWYPCWFLLSAFGFLAAGSELIGLMGATSVRPRALS